MSSRANTADITMGEIISRIRGFIYDSQAEDGEHISLLLGCPDISEEVEEMEIKKSDERVARIDTLIPLLYAYAHSMAEGIVGHQMTHLSEDERNSVESDAWVQTRKVFSRVAMNALMGAVSQLVDMNVLIPATEKKGFRRWMPKSMKQWLVRRHITRVFQSR